MGTLKERLERAVADKGLSIGDAWNLLSEALEHIERLEADAKSHPPIPVRGEPMACPCGKCPDGYFGAEG